MRSILTFDILNQQHCMTNSIRVIWISIFLLFSVTGQAQYTLSGIVSDKSDKTKLIEGATLFIPEFNRIDLSKEGGTYIFRNLHQGRINVQVTRAGYRSRLVQVSLKDSATVVNVEMEPALIDLQEVTVTGNRERLPDMVPYALSTMTRDELERQGAVHVVSALAYQPGIDKITLGNGIQKPVIRGLSFNRLLIYQYGTRIENQPWDDRHDMGVNENGVDQVEVLKGPAALMVGPDALAGAIIFTDEKPAALGTTSGDVDLGFFTNTLGIRGRAGVKGMNNNGLFYSFRGGWQSHTSYIQGEGEERQKNEIDKDFAPNSKFGSTDAKLVLGTSKRWGVSKLTYSYLRQQIGIVEQEDESQYLEPEQFTEEQRDREFEAPYQDVTNHIVSSENSILLPGGRINANLSFQHNDRKEFEPTADGGKEKAIGLRLNTLTYDLRYGSDGEKRFEWSLGTQGYIQGNRNNGLEGLVPDADITNLGVYGLIHYDWKNLRIMAGGRIDSRSMDLESYEGGEETDSTEIRPEIELEKEYTLLNGSVGLVWKFHKGWTLKGNFGTGVTAPNYLQLATYGPHEGAYRFEIGNQQLEQEQSRETDLGLSWEGRWLAINAQAYYNQVANFIYLQNTGRFDSVTVAGKDSLYPVYNYVQNNATLSGGELTLNIHHPKASWIDLQLAYGMTVGELDRGGNLPFIPANKTVASLSIHKPRLNYLYEPFARIVLSNYAKQDKLAEFEQATDGYQLIDLHLGGSFHWGRQQFDITVSVNNLLNEGYFNHLSLIRAIGYREMGRNVAIRLRVPFGIHNGS
ncbi:MAG: TonB-dependent receptor [Bacteroidota bacterium]